MRLTIESVSVPPMSTIGFGVGSDETGKRWRFVGDWRPMAAICEALEAGEDVEANVPEWALQEEA